VKVFTSRCEVSTRGLIDIFHAWVKNRRTADLLIDVHNYSHVVGGPGVVLVAHEAHYAMDTRDGELGLVYRARRTPLLAAADALDKAAQAAWTACRYLEEDSAGQIVFSTDSLLVGFEDRLHAPNNSESFAQFSPSIASWARRRLGDGVALAQVGAPRDVFGVRIRGAQGSLADWLA
jgi:hypothetical protein